MPARTHIALEAKRWCHRTGNWKQNNSVRLPLGFGRNEITPKRVWMHMWEDRNRRCMMWLTFVQLLCINGTYSPAVANTGIAVTIPPSPSPWAANMAANVILLLPFFLCFFPLFFAAVTAAVAVVVVFVVVHSLFFLHQIERMVKHFSFDEPTTKWKFNEHYRNNSITATE